MKVFISSLIGGFETYRDAADEAIRMLGHEVVRAENFPASARSPQEACLAGVRDSDVALLILGDRYGVPQDSRLSATHEEYLEARERMAVLVFIEEPIQPEPSQRDLLNEVEGWSTGHFRAAFSSPEQLKAAVVRGLHDHELAVSSGAVDEGEILERARGLIPERRSGFVGEPAIAVVVAGGPRQQVLRPAELESPELARHLQQQALFGDHAVFDPSEGSQIAVRNDALEIEQRSAKLSVNELGTILVQRSLSSRGSGRAEIPAIIEEDLIHDIATALQFVGTTLDHVDPVRRISDVVPAVALLDTGYMAWRNREEHERSPGSGQMGMRNKDVVAVLSPARRHRQALLHDTERLAEDLVVLLRRGRS